MLIIKFYYENIIYHLLSVIFQEKNCNTKKYIKTNIKHLPEKMIDIDLIFKIDNGLIEANIKNEEVYFLCYVLDRQQIKV